MIREIFEVCFAFVSILGGYFVLCSIVGRICGYNEGEE